MEALKTQLKQLIIDELHLNEITPSAIADEAPLFGEGLGLDSLDALQLAVAIEEKFGVRIGDEKDGKVAFASIVALANFIQNKKT